MSEKSVDCAESEDRRSQSNVVYLGNYNNRIKGLKLVERRSSQTVQSEISVSAENILDEYKNTFVASLDERLDEIRRITREHAASLKSPMFDYFKYAMFREFKGEPPSKKYPYSEEELDFYRKVACLEEDWKIWGGIFREINIWHHRFAEAKSDANGSGEAINKTMQALNCKSLQHITCNISESNVRLFEEFVQSASVE